jgi:hypothetical protein
LKFDVEIDALRGKIGDLLTSAAVKPLSTSARVKIDRQLRALIGELEDMLGQIDPISMPTSIFDPSSPKVIGRFTSLALIAQTLHPLSAIGKFYGSGVYAIYYRGDFPLYAPLSGTETPIYVGQAAPSSQGARTAREQGPRLAARLNDHRKNILKAISTLNLDDFDARFLVVQSGWETAAEDYLIHLFRPVWNSETNILYGLGKHGDDAKTRQNKRSPWDTLHPGRKWAAASIEDARSPQGIATDLGEHFQKNAPFTDRGQLLDSFFDELRQN